jgi:hypothetical protein
MEVVLLDDSLTLGKVALLDFALRHTLGKEIDSGSYGLQVRKLAQLVIIQESSIQAII